MSFKNKLNKAFTSFMIKVLLARKANYLHRFSKCRRLDSELTSFRVRFYKLPCFFTFFLLFDIFLKETGIVGSPQKAILKPASPCCTWTNLFRKYSQHLCMLLHTSILLNVYSWENILMFTFLALSIQWWYTGTDIYIARIANWKKSLFSAEVELKHTSRFWVPEHILLQLHKLNKWSFNMEPFSQTDLKH